MSKNTTGRDKIFAKIGLGRLKGKKILLPPKEITRSSKAILRESLFNTIGSDIIDSVFIEMFAGSGSIGIEALSVGARSAYFFELNRESFNILKENIQTLGLSQNSTLIFGDSFVFFEDRIKQIELSKKFIYIDPPFCTRSGFLDIYDKVIFLISKITHLPFTIFIIEHISTYIFPDNLGNFVNFKRRKFGKTTLSYYTNVLN